MRRRAALAALGAYVVATVLFTWPLSAHLRTRFPAPTHPSTYNDTLLMAWVLSWDLHQLPRDPLRLFDANIFYPLRHTLACSEALVSEALLLLPLSPLTPNPVLLHNTALLTSFVIGAWGAFLLVRHLSGDPLAAFLGGLMFAFCPYRFWQVDRLHVLAVHWTPFLFLALHRYLEAGGRLRAAALGGAFLLQALASVYVAYASAILSGLLLAGCLVVNATGARRRAPGAVGVLGAAGVLVALVYIPYWVLRSEMALARDPAQVVLHSVVPAELGRALLTMPRYLAAKLATGGRGAGTLGFVAAVLMWWGIVAGGRLARLYAALTLAALLFSFGPVVVLPGSKTSWVPGPYRLLYDYLPGFTALREPRRWTGFVVACGTVVAGLGVAALLRRARGPAGRMLGAGVIALLVAAEVGWRPLALSAPPEYEARRPLYRTVSAAAAGGAVIELPIGADREEAVATFRSAYHLRPLLNGYSGFRPTTADLRRRLRRFPDRKTVALLRRLGVRFILYDTGRPGTHSLRGVRRRLARAAPAARLRASAAGTALIEVEPLPAVLPSAARRVEVPRTGWHVEASTGGPEAALDGDLATHWSATVDPSAGGGWYEVDFGRETEFDLLSLELGAHYGEYPRAWRVMARDGDRTWVVAARRHAPAPLASYRTDHLHVVVELPLPPTRSSGLRIEVPPLRLPGRQPPFDLAPDHWEWHSWGIHELRVYRRTPAPVADAAQARDVAERE